ncbi:hypothetical protein AVDCRST_MAG92-4404 [uncultured Coleofasciculus sp.]|uniref:Uncharacterized protein n=1 Tax=uncultured Coleofasciculus sp. TaxID=1267456 RepID=A0A6J4JZQ5_9CYAN|nr:hypothetical protein AVDCRST_MAG92-4404 [uncultured Coleofasciculus sp.]
MSSHSLSVKLLVYGIDSKTAFLFNLSLSSEIPNGFYTVGFDFNNDNIGSVLAFNEAQGSSTMFTGFEFTNISLERPIGITAVPAPSSISCGASNL